MQYIDSIPVWGAHEPNTLLRRSPLQSPLLQQCSNIASAVDHGKDNQRSRVASIHDQIRLRVIKVDRLRYQILTQMTNTRIPAESLEGCEQLLFRPHAHLPAGVFRNGVE
jgi:hypothetical protein